MFATTALRWGNGELDTATARGIKDGLTELSIMCLSAWVNTLLAGNGLWDEVSQGRVGCSPSRSLDPRTPDFHTSRRQVPSGTTAPAVCETFARFWIAPLDPCFATPLVYANLLLLRDDAEAAVTPASTATTLGV